jgi:branched-chain amino acid transport system substrate-binding protein
MDQHFPEGDRNNSYPVLGYSVAQTFVQVLRQCGDDLTRENLMRQTADLKNVWECFCRVSP